MGTSFPTSVDTYSTKVDDAPGAPGTTVVAADVNNLQDAIRAIETQLLNRDKYHAEVHLNNVQHIAPNTTPVVLFDSKDGDPDSLFDTTLGRFTCPVDGRYLVNCTLRYGSSADAAILLYWNGVEAKRLIESTAATWLEMGGGAVIRCAAGDYLEIRVYQNSVNTVDVQPGGSYSHAEFSFVGAL